MEWILAGFVILALAAAAVIGSGRWGAMPPVVDDRFPGLVPAGELDAADLRDVRFSVVPRGYSMAQVDALLARLADQIERPAMAGVQSGGPDDIPASEHRVAEVPGEDATAANGPLTTPDAGATPIVHAENLPAQVSGDEPSGVAYRGEHRSL